MNDNPWEDIYRRDGHVFRDVPPSVPVFTDLLAQKQWTGKRLLDVGCGNGRNLVYFSQHGYQVNGLDSSPSALGLAREWLGRESLPGALIRSDSRRAFPFPDEAFDVLVSTQVIHHALLDTVLFTISEITRVVRTGGYILITVPGFREKVEEDGASVEIEPHTFVPLSGPEKGLPHHLFRPEEFHECFPAFEILSLGDEDGRRIVLVGRKK